MQTTSSKPISRVVLSVKQESTKTQPTKSVRHALVTVESVMRPDVPSVMKDFMRVLESAPNVLSNALNVCLTPSVSDARIVNTTWAQTSKPALQIVWTNSSKIMLE